MLNTPEADQKSLSAQRSAKSTKHCRTTRQMPRRTTDHCPGRPGTTTPGGSARKVGGVESTRRTNQPARRRGPDRKPRVCKPRGSKFLKRITKLMAGEDLSEHDTQMLSKNAAPAHEYDLQCHRHGCKSCNAEYARILKEMDEPEQQQQPQQVGVDQEMPVTPWGEGPIFKEVMEAEARHSRFRPARYNCQVPPVLGW